MLKRVFDWLFSLVFLIVLSPIFVFLAIWIKLDSQGPVFYKQQRVGRDGKDFWLYKFRSMRVGSDKSGLLTVGGRDPRITSSGYVIRKYKLDEIPQLINVFLGEMSVVGPRPEVRKYVNMYNAEQLKVLSVRPGISDFASIRYRNENDLLEKAENPEQFYIDEVMPEKLRINLEYVNKANLATDIRIIFATLGAIIK